jgi:hypothetical protein
MTPVHPNDKIREAKVFLASRIAEEADREGIPLTEIERKMLYYCQTGWTLPDMPEVKAAFDRDYDRALFESRMRRLIRRARSRLMGGDRAECETWQWAIQELRGQTQRGQDHYVLALIAAAPPTGEITRLVITALVIIGVILVALFLVSRGY